MYGLGYEKDHNNLFHIHNYCKPIKFVNNGFLVNVDRKEELDKEHVRDVDHDVDTNDIIIEDINTSIRICWLMMLS
jgi:hypothetical protein